MGHPRCVLPLPLICGLSFSRKRVQVHDPAEDAPLAATYLHAETWSLAAFLALRTMRHG